MLKAGAGAPNPVGMRKRVTGINMEKDTDPELE
jgi:hypothetical protein